MTESASFKDHFSGHSSQYATARPRYSEELFQFVQSFAIERKLAWDCGAGSGQATIGLKPYFETVIATDASENQIREFDGIGTERGIFRAAMLAEHCALADHSVDLAVVAQALHWFDCDKFFAEIDRVLKPGGVLAIWSYGIQEIDVETDMVVNKLYDGLLGDFWPPERSLVETGYKSIKLPYKEQDCPDFVLQKRWSLKQLFAYFRSWSAVQRFKRANGKDPVAMIADELQAAWFGTDNQRQDMEKVISWPLSVRVTIKPIKGH